MDKKTIFILAILGLMFIGFIHNNSAYPMTTTTTTTKKVIVNPQQPPKYGYRPPPAYNPYKAQYYN